MPTEPTVLCEISQSRRSDVTWNFHVRGDWGGGDILLVLLPWHELNAEAVRVVAAVAIVVVSA